MKIEKQKTRELVATFRLIEDNFRIFTSEIIGLKNAPFHKELDDTLSNQLNRKIAIALPRGFGKSTHAVACSLWEIGKNHNIRILFVSNTGEISKTSLAAVKGHIEKNRKYQFWARGIDPKGRGVLPQLRPKHKREENWSADAITIARSDLQIKDPTVSAVGLFGSIVSRRVDIIILDDVCNQENSWTEEGRQKIKDWVYTTLMPVLVPGGKFICIGNTWHQDDLVGNFLKDPQFDVRKRMPAIIHEATRQDLWEEWADVRLDESLAVEQRRSKAEAFYLARKEEMDLGIELLWPERFPYSALYLDRLANPYSFARMFQCDPSIRPNQQFLEKDIQRALDKGKDLVLGNTLPEGIEIDYITFGLDLAISQAKGADYTALLALGHVRYGKGEIKDGDFIILNILRGKFRPEETITMTKRLNAIMQPIGVRVESVGFQELVVDSIDDGSVPVRGFKTGREKNDPDIGVYSLSLLLERGRLVLPYSNKDSHTRQTTMQLVNEMRAYPDGHTGDSLMSLWFAYSEMRDYLQNRVTFPSSSTYTPPPTGPADEKAADQELIGKQELARSNDPATVLLRQANEALERAAPRPRPVDPEIEAAMHQKMREGISGYQAIQWATSQQREQEQDAKAYWNEEARRVLKR